MTHTRSRIVSFIFDNSLLLLAGTVLAVAWANIDYGSYDKIAHPLDFWVNDVGMVFFFALAAKEVFEATLPGGPLASPRRAASPLAAAVGGMIAPALIYVALVMTRGPADLIRGWVRGQYGKRDNTSVFADRGDANVGARSTGRLREPILVVIRSGRFLRSR